MSTVETEYRMAYLDHLRSVETKLDVILECLMELLDKRHRDDDFEQRVQNIYDHYLYVIGEKSALDKGKTINVSDELYAYLQRVSDMDSLPTPLNDDTEEYHGLTPDQVCSRIIMEWMILQAQKVIPLTTVERES